MVNPPLQGAGEGQTIEPIMKVMRYLLLWVAANDTDRANGDMSFPIITGSETDRVELAILDGNKYDAIDAGRKLSRSGSNSSRIGPAVACHTP